MALVALAGATLLISCGSSSASAPDEPVLGIAYAGPATLNLRKDLTTRSATLVSVKHGEKLEILETRRKFVRVRTKDGAQGWADANLLLTAEQMDELKQMSSLAAKLPSIGRATVFEPLNVHSQPNRQSPSFYQIPEGGSVEVIGHRVMPRIQPSAKPIVEAPKRVAPKKKSKAARAAEAMLIQSPPPPGPPNNWQEISRPRVADLPDYTAPVTAPPAMDDWNLVRSPDGKAGWVLARMLFMAIPDEVAQYAEGHRIVAYLPLGPVMDGDQKKESWVWATAASNYHASDFDSFRVFVWSLKHHRYETAHVERNVTGYFPMELVSTPGHKQQGFSLVLREKDGKLAKRTYSFDAFRVKLVSKDPLDRVPQVLPLLAQNSAKPVDGQESSAQSASWWRKIAARFPLLTSLQKFQ